MVDLERLKLPAVSRDCMEVLRLLDDEDADNQALVRAIGLDPVLAGTVLRYANSPLHRRAREVCSVQQAINVLGRRKVRAAAVVATMRGFCGQNVIASLLWEHGVAVSTLARTIAQPRFRSLADEVELIGLLHNLGAQVLLTNFPALYAQMVEGIRQDGTLVHVAELEVFGVHRGELVPLLAERFHLPRRVSQALAGYHAQCVPHDVESDSARGLACLWLAQVAGRRAPTAADWLPEWLPADITTLMQLVDIGEEEFANLSEDCDALVTERVAA